MLNHRNPPIAEIAYVGYFNYHAEYVNKDLNIIKLNESFLKIQKP
jgi:hypothetical protein